MKDHQTTITKISAFAKGLLQAPRLSSFYEATISSRSIALKLVRFAVAGTLTFVEGLSEMRMQN